jgi:hypothetical protein
MLVSSKTTEFYHAHFFIFHIILVAIDVLPILLGSLKCTLFHKAYPDALNLMPLCIIIISLLVFFSY